MLIFMRIETIMGLDERLVCLVAHLVRDPEGLRQNNNYPFKTSARYVWFVATEGEHAVGFIPVEMRDNCCVINNYYLADNNLFLLEPLLKEAIGHFAGKYSLQSVVHSRHKSVFEENGFAVIRTWKLYVKMQYQGR